MSKILIWVGNFESEDKFEQYLNQSSFRRWKLENDDNNLDLRCQFCKEIEISDYNEDFLIMKFSKEGITNLINLIPAKTEEIQEVLSKKNINKANSVICYSSGKNISTSQASKVIKTTFLGTFTFEPEPIGNTKSTAGLNYMVWIGHTSKMRDEFMEYFNQEEYLKELADYENGITKKRPNPELRCQFCKDLNIKYYHPEFLRIVFSQSNETPLELLKKAIQDENIPDRWLIYDLTQYNISHANCVFCYIPNGFRDRKKNQKIFILKKDWEVNSYTPKKYINELDHYNGLIYLSTYIWN